MSQVSLMLDVAGLQASQQELQVLSHPFVGGVILFQRNYESPEQLAQLVAQLRSLDKPLLIAVDQEGGRVQRLREPFSRLPSPQQLTKQYLQNPQQGLLLARECGWLMAAEMRSMDIDISFAPVLDVDWQRCKAIADRAFSDDPEQLIVMATAYIDGMSQAGMASCGKHFPGHGGVVEDSHVSQPIDRRALSELLARDLLPYRRLRLDSVMIAHITFPQVDATSAVYSTHWQQHILRNRLGFDGIIFSDDLSMAGADLALSAGQRVLQAATAGCQVALVCNHPEQWPDVFDRLEGSPFTPLDSAVLAPLRGLEQRLSWSQLQASERWQACRRQLAPLFTS